MNEIAGIMILIFQYYNFSFSYCNRNSLDVDETMRSRQDLSGSGEYVTFC